MTEMREYRYELHCHCSEISPCGQLPAEDLARLYEAAGYDGIVLTDHFRQDILEALPGSSWREKREAFLEPYRRLEEKYRDSGFWIARGAELRFGTNENDFLLFGFADELFLEEGETWPFMELPEFYETYKKEMLIIQAHPNRADSCFPEPIRYLHGIEVKNTCPRHENGNELSRKTAEENPWLIATGGSDCHRPEDVAGSGIACLKPLAGNADLVTILKNRAYRIL